MKRIGRASGAVFALLSAGCLSQAGESLKTESGSLPQCGSDAVLSWGDQGLEASTQWVQKPSADKKDGDLLVKFWRPKTGGAAEGPYVPPGVELPVTLFMPEHGHESDVEPQAVAERDAQGDAVPGVFHVKPIHFIMGGWWEIRVGGAVCRYPYKKP